MTEFNKKNGKKIKAEYLSCESYPTSWSHGIRRMLELMMIDPEDESELVIDDPSKIESVVESKLDSFLKSIKVITMEED